MDNKVYCTMTPSEAATVVIALAKYIQELQMNINTLQFLLDQAKAKAGGGDGAEA